MKRRPIIPNGHVISLPLESDLQVMVLCDQRQKVGFDDLALAVRHVIDPAFLDQTTDAEEGLPARDRVRAHDRVGDFEVESGVLWGASVTVEQLVVEFLLDTVELRLMVRCCQTLCELLPRRREPVINFIARSPECVAPSIILRKCVEFQNGIIRWDALKRNTSRGVRTYFSTTITWCYSLRVPTFASKAPIVVAISVVIMLTVLLPQSAR